MYHLAIELPQPRPHYRRYPRMFGFEPRIQALAQIVNATEWRFLRGILAAGAVRGKLVDQAADPPYLPESSWIFSAVSTRRSSTLKLPMAILAGATAGTAACVSVVASLAPLVLNKLSPVLVLDLDHVDEAAPEPEVELGEDPREGARCDALSCIVPAELHEAQVVLPAASWYQCKIREMMEAYSRAR